MITIWFILKSWGYTWLYLLPISRYILSKHSTRYKEGWTSAVHGWTKRLGIYKSVTTMYYVQYIVQCTIHCTMYCTLMAGDRIVSNTTTLFDQKNSFAVSTSEIVLWYYHSMLRWVIWSLPTLMMYRWITEIKGFVGN